MEVLLEQDKAHIAGLAQARRPQGPRDT